MEQDDSMALCLQKHEDTAVQPNSCNSTLPVMMLSQDMASRDTQSEFVLKSNCNKVQVLLEQLKRGIIDVDTYAYLSEQFLQSDPVPSRVADFDGTELSQDVASQEAAQQQATDVQSTRMCLLDKHGGDDTTYDDGREGGDAPTDMSEAEMAADKTAKKFLSSFKQPPPSKVEKKRKVKTMPVKPRGSTKKQGSRKNDVRPATLRKNVEEYAHRGIEVRSGQAFCVPCAGNVGSALQAMERHCKTVKHEVAEQKLAAAQDDGVLLRKAIDDFIDVHEEDGQVPMGFSKVSKQCQVFRADVLQSWLTSGIPPNKLDKVRGLLERYASLELTSSRHLMSEYMPVLRLKEDNKLKEELMDELIAMTLATRA